MGKLLLQLDAALDQVDFQVLAQNQGLDPAPGYRLPAGLAERQALREEIKKGLAQLQPMAASIIIPSNQKPGA